jgi:hypothetical protein
MRDWLMVLSPLALTFYFMINPEQFAAFTDWVGNVIR